jgi:hypothetical protein
MWRDAFDRIVVRGEEPLPLPPVPEGPGRDDERDLFDDTDEGEGSVGDDDDDREPGGAE